MDRMNFPQPALLRSRNTSGQAATEFLVAAVFILAPLFLLIPLVGKYIDIQQAAVQQARYEAWEYTAWFGPSETIMDGIRSDQRADRKAWLTTREEGNRIFFTDITDPRYGDRTFEPAINPLWQDHHSQSLFVVQSRVKATGSQKEEQTPDPSAIVGGKNLIDDLLQGIKDVTKTFGDLLHIIGVKAKFDAINSYGYFTTRVNVQVRSPGQVLPVMELDEIGEDTGAEPITIETGAAVLSNSWEAGSRENALEESRGLVLSSLLKPVTGEVNKVIDDIEKVLHYIPGLIADLPHPPEFGYVQDDLIPYEDLQVLSGSGGKKHSQDSPYHEHKYSLQNYNESFYYYEAKD